MHKTDDAFWVVFDTSQYPAYYRDVHDLIAAPRRFVLRYQYREELLSDSARTLALKQKSLPVLLLYIQKNAIYARQANKSIPADENENNLIVLTRLGRMLNVVRHGGRYYFDFQVTGYPDNDRGEHTNALLAPLIRNNEIPWIKWVATSTDNVALAAISEGADGDNWRKIINALGRNPMQFAGDAFWRLKGPFTQSGRTIKPKLRNIKEEGFVRRIRAEYHLGERAQAHFQLVSYTPEQISEARPEYRVQAAVSGSEKVKIIGSGQYELRHYDEKPIEYVSEEMGPYRTEPVDLVFETQPTAETWTAGAKLEVRHQVRKSRFISTLGVISGIAGLSMVALGSSKLFENDALYGATILFVGLVMLAAAKYMLTGTLEFGK